MKLPKYKFLSIPCIINAIIGGYVLGFLYSLDIGLAIPIMALLCCQTLFIVLYENLRIHLGINDDER